MTISPFWIAAAVFVFCVIERVPLERSMTTHVLVLMPLLVAAGWFAGRGLAVLRPKLLKSDWNAAGAAGLLLALFAGAVWMLPRMLDWSLGEPAGDVAKFLSLPLLAGLPLALSWPCMPSLLRGFLKANAISMSLTLSWLYMTAPARLCTNYVLEQQVQLGSGFLVAAFILFVLWTAPLLGVTLSFRRPRRRPVLVAGTLS
jgi:hypothetical protein